jgi:hypothetical protein
MTATFCRWVSARGQATLAHLCPPHKLTTYLYLSPWHVDRDLRPQNIMVFVLYANNAIREREMEVEGI